MYCAWLKPMMCQWCIAPTARQWQLSVMKQSQSAVMVSDHPVSSSNVVAGHQPSASAHCSFGICTLFRFVASWLQTVCCQLAARTAAAPDSSFAVVLPC